LNVILTAVIVRQTRTHTQCSQLCVGNSNGEWEWEDELVNLFIWAK